MDETQQSSPAPSKAHILWVKWNEVTWYSMLGARVLFLGIVPVLFFYLGWLAGSITPFVEPVVMETPPHSVAGKVSEEDGRPSGVICDALFAGELKESTPLPFECNWSIGPGTAATFAFSNTGSIEVKQEGVTPSLLDVENDHINIIRPDGLSPWSLMFEDINFDGYVDLGLESEGSGAYNIFYSYYTYDPVKRTYAPATIFPKEASPLTGPQFDSEAKTITSFDKARGIGDIFVESMYHFEDGHYVLVKQTAQDGDFDTLCEEGYTRTTKELKDGKLVVTETKHLSVEEVTGDASEVCPGE